MVQLHASVVALILQSIKWVCAINTLSMPKQKIVILAVILLLSVINYQRISGHENVRGILVISLLTIGALIALLIVEIVKRMNYRKKGL